MKSNQIENQLIENEYDIRKFGKKKNNNKINHRFVILLIFFLIICIFVLIYYLINYKENSNDLTEKNSYNLIEKASDEFLFLKASDKNNIFNISIKNYNSYIKINANYDKTISEGEYERKIYLNELIFNSFWDTVTKAYKQIVFEIKKDYTKKLLIENKYYINIIIPVDYEYYKQINLTIPKKIKTDIYTFQNLINEIKDLNEEIDLLKNKINDKTKMFFNVSSIIRNDFDKQKKLMNWIEQKLNKNIILELIFKMTENGFTAKDFHHYCDNKGPTLILIKTSNDEIIGGFTPLNWETTTEREKKYDELGLTFLFSLTLNKKFDMIKRYTYPAIENVANLGPEFGVDDLFLDTNLREGISYAYSDCNFFHEGKMELVEEKGETLYVGGDKWGDGIIALFKVSEFEVYKVNY